MPSPPQMPPKCPQKVSENTGEGGPGNYFKIWSLFAIGNGNKQTTETSDKELFHECNIEKGKKFLLGGQPVFLFVNYFSCSYLLKLPLQFNKLSSKTKKTPSFRNHLYLQGTSSEPRSGDIQNFKHIHPPCWQNSWLYLPFLSQLSKKSRTNTKPNTACSLQPHPTLWVPVVPPSSPDNHCSNSQTATIQTLAKTSHGSAQFRKPGWEQGCRDFRMNFFSRGRTDTGKPLMGQTLPSGFFFPP